MTTFGVNTTSLTDATRQLVSITGRITDEGAALARQPVPAMDDPAYAAVGEFLTTWAAAIARLVDRLESFGADTYVAGTLYEQTDQALARDWAAAHPPPKPSHGRYRPGQVI